MATTALAVHAYQVTRQFFQHCSACQYALYCIESCGCISAPAGLLQHGGYLLVDAGADVYEASLYSRMNSLQVNDGPCTTYLGSIGSGNYVKMVHNGIEYGDMQLIAEVRWIVCF